MTKKFENFNDDAFFGKDKDTLPPNVIALLQDLQEKKGYLDRDDLIKLSRELSIPAVQLYGVATFYSQFRLEKQGKHVITVCSGTACHVKKSAEIVKYLEKLLDIKSGETTKNGKFTLETVNCIGACARAPAMMIDEVVYGELTNDKAKKIIQEIK